MKHFDVIINGGGMVGATLACLLAKQQLKVAVIEAFETSSFSPDDEFDLRVSAISRASQNAFITAGVWGEILAMRATPYEAMDVWDSEGEGNVRFEASQLGEPDIGHIIENKIIQLALNDALKKADTVTLYQPNKLKSYQANDPRGVAFKMLRGTDRQMNGKPSYLGIKIELYKIKVFKACSKSIFKQFELIC